MGVFDMVECVESADAKDTWSTDSSGSAQSSVVDTMLRSLSATSEGFAYGSTALAAALHDQHQVTIAANLLHEATGLPHLSCWHCRHDERGIDLVPFACDSLAVYDPGTPDAGAARLIGDGRRGDVLIACDPWGDNELLCWALRIASHRGLTTVAITTEQPNLLAALAGHAVRVPVEASFRQEFVAATLRFLVQTAGGAMESRRRTTQPLPSHAVSSPNSGPVNLAVARDTSRYRRR